MAPHPSPAERASALARAWAAFRTKGWLKPFRNALPLLAGRSGQAAFSLLATALATRALGVEVFGVMVLILAFRQIVTALTKLRARDTMMRYGAQALAADDPPRFRRVLRFSFMIDGISALAATAVVLGLTDLVAGQLDLAADHRQAARLYGLSAVLVLLSHTAEGLLRLFDRFDLVGVQPSLTPAVRALGAVALYATGAGLESFLAVWFAGLAAGRLWLIAAAVRELRRRVLGGPGRFAWRDLTHPEPGVWRFTVGNYLNDAVGEVRRQLGVLLMGGLIGPSAAGLLRVAKQIGELPGKPVGKILTPAIFPEMARLSAADAHGKRRKMALRSGLIAAGIAVVLTAVLVLFGKTLIALIFTPAFTEAYTAMVIFAGAGILQMTLFPLRPMLASSGRIYLVLGSRLVGVAGWAAAIVLLVPSVGIAAAAIGEVLSILLGGCVMLVAARGQLRRGRDNTADTGAAA